MNLKFNHSISSPNEDRTKWHDDDQQIVLPSFGKTGHRETMASNLTKVAQSPDIHTEQWPPAKVRPSGLWSLACTHDHEQSKNQNSLESIFKLWTVQCIHQSISIAQFISVPSWIIREAPVGCTYIWSPPRKSKRSPLPTTTCTHVQKYERGTRWPTRQDSRLCQTECEQESPEEPRPWDGRCLGGNGLGYFGSRLQYTASQKHWIHEWIDLQR
mgnify:CR=1 FL=1